MHVKKAFVKMMVVAAAMFGATASAADVAPAQGIDSTIARHMEQAGIMGMGAAVIIGGKVVWTKGYGYADKEHGVPFTPSTVMNIGSISKTVTGVAMMRAAQDGKLNIDADINRYLPFKVVNPYHPGERITLRHLATHTAGIADHPTVYRDSYHFGGDATEPLGDFLKGYFVAGGATYSKDNFIDAKPGTQREYSNIGAGLAGYIIERAVGEKLSTYTKRLIFAPLKMNDSGWFLSEMPAARHATLYVAQDGITIPILPYGLTTYPDGGVRTSVADLSKFFIALLGDGAYEGARILDPAAVEEMTRFQFNPANKPANMVLNKENSGLFWATKMSVTRVGHGGSDPGLKTEMLANLQKDIGIVMFINTSLAEQDMRHYVALYKDVWAHAEALKLAQVTGGR